MNLVIKDAFWQIWWRILSALAWFLVIKLITPYLGPLRYWDYSTILKYFAIWSAFADFWLYVLALRDLGKIKDRKKWKKITEDKEWLLFLYNKYIWARFFLIFVVYTLALVVAYLIPAYTSNPFLIRWLPLGMIFSATFMASGIIQLPLQLFWQMKHVTFALLLARIVQITILILTIYILFTNVNFSTANPISLAAFLFILGSVLISGLVQFGYTRWIWKKYLPLYPIFDRSFIKDILKQNWQYWLAYYLSSFHTLVVLILLSIFYPTSEGFKYVGIWALALALIEILLIVPSALGNSLIHKISWIEKNIQLKKFGALMVLVIWIGTIIWINFYLFGPNIIYIIAGIDYLSNWKNIWADFILIFLGLVLILSFVKQIFNYIFVSQNIQNKLLFINLAWVLLGVSIGLPFIIKYNLWGGIFMQLLLEILFVWFAIWIAWKYKILPYINKVFLIFILGLIIIAIIGKYFINLNYNQFLQFLILAFLVNITILLFSYKWIKQIIKNL